MPGTQRASRRAILNGLVVSSALVAAWSLAMDGCALAMRPPPPPSPADSFYARTSLQGVLDDHFRYIQFSRPEIAAWAGGWVPALPDVSQDAVKRDAQFARAALTQLDGIDVRALEEDDYVSWLTLRWDMEELSGWPAFHWTRLSDASPGRSPLDAAARILRMQRIGDEASGQRFLALVSGVDSMVGTIRQGYVDRAERDIRIPDYLLPRAIAHVRSFLAPTSASPFGLPTALDVSPDSEWLVSLQQVVAGLITEKINPAIESLARDLEGSYRASAPASIGLSQYPGGLAHYAALLRFHTTLDITPEDAHAIGIREASRLAILAAAARADAGLPGDRDSLRAVLRRDPRFAAGAADSGLAVQVQLTLSRLYEDAARRLDSLFQPGPTSPLAISVMTADESALLPLTTYDPPSVPDPVARYRVSVGRLDRRSLIELPALVYEDLMPGLHYQQAAQREDGSRPSSRRVAWHGGFVRGWQVYALALADSLSPQSGAASHFGVVQRELAHACGLVVDTGINALGWKREQALAFLRSYLPYDDDELEREFIVTAAEQPGELAAATLGAREIGGLRRWAERELGDRFDLAGFHREVLRTGSVPLPVLGAHLERWLWEEAHRVEPPTSSAPPPARSTSDGSPRR